MKVLLTIYFTIILTNCNVWGQPGGGGGVIIQTLIDKNGNLISSHDSVLLIRKFILSGKEGLSVKEYDKTAENSSFPKHATVNRGGLYVRPYLNIIKEIKTPHQLIQFIYNRDTVFIEFEDIMEEGTGFSNWMDTLQLIPGSYKIPFRFLYDAYYIKNGTANDTKRFDSIAALARRGLTATTLPMLQPLGILYKMVDKRFTTIYQHTNNTIDTVTLPVKPVYVMNVQSISPGSNSIKMSVNASPMLERDTLLYRIIMNVPSFSLMGRRGQVNKDQQKTITFLKDLTTKPLYINGQLYTGHLKIFTAFSEFRPGSVQVSGVSMNVMYFNKGIFLRREYFPDIELDESREPVRPS